MLATWVESVRRTGVKNFMVIAMDEHTGAGAAVAHTRPLGIGTSACCRLLTSPNAACRVIAGAMEKIGVAYWRAKAADLADKAQDNHGISAQKFHLLREFLSLGYRVLLSGAVGAKRVSCMRQLMLPFGADVDIVTLQNPFNFLVRDSDVEGLSDGFDERTAYGACRWTKRALSACRAEDPHVAGYVDGIDDPGMGWARYAQTIRIFVLNSGLFYIQPSERTVRPSERIGLTYFTLNSIRCMRS